MMRGVLLGFLLAAGTGSSWAADVASPPLGVEAFFHRPLYTSVKISPDGHYLAVVGSVKGDETQTVLEIVDLNDMQGVGAYTLRDRQQVYDLWWVDSEMIAFTSYVKAGGFDRPFRTGIIWTTDISGTAVKRVGFGQVLSASNAHPGHLIYEDFTSPTLTALTVDVYNEHEIHSLRKFTSSLENGYMTTDNDENVRLASGFNEKTIEPKLMYHDANPKSLEWKDMSSLVLQEPRYSAFGPVMFTPDSSSFYYDGVTPAGTLGLFLVDTKDFGKKLLYSDPDFDVDYTYSDTYWLTSADARSLVAFQYDAELPQWIVVKQDAPEAQTLAALQDAFQGQAVRITSITADGTRAIVLVYGDRNPGEYYLYDAKGQKVQLLFSVRPEIKLDDMAEMKPVTLKARDGKTLHGYLTLPHGRSKNVPLIVYPHGGPFGIRDQWDFNSDVQLLAYHGYAVLQVNYRGSGGYGEAFQEAGYQQWGGTMQDDVTDATHWAIDQGVADPKRICIYGASYGGYAALEGVVKEPDLYKCAVGYAGVYDLVMERNKAHTLHGRTLIPFMSRTLGDDEAALNANSPYLHVDKIKADLFLTHGGFDKTVDVDQVNELRGALDKIKKPYEWVYFPNEGHGYYALDHNVELYTKMLAFFDEEIGPGQVAH
jgi:dipeptidyl aminopeptidase/acylaminoacyl peptidase